MYNKQVIAALASDLKRVTLGLERNSIKMSERFSSEALKRTKEIDLRVLPVYITEIIEKLPQTLHKTNTLEKAEDVLMYSTLLQNYITTE